MTTSAWREVLGGDPRLQVVEGALGRGSTHLAEVAGCRLLVLRGAPLSVRVAAGAGPALVVAALAEGAATLRQDGHAWDLDAGGVVLLDGRQTAALVAHAPFCLVALGMASAARMTLGTLDPLGHTVDRLLRDAALALVAEGPGRPALVAAAQALLAGCSAAQAPESVRLRWADRYIDEHLAEPDLSPERVAAAQQVSRRWLDKAFAARGETLAGAIHERRLQAAARLLQAEGLAVGEVAVRCGFPSVSALSHAFRKRFGRAPSEWRE